MTILPFLAFATVFMALVCAHFVLAYHAWQVSRGEEYSDIDPDYVRMDDYFARSFRQKIAEWLQLPVSATFPGGICVIRKGSEQIRVSGSLEHPWRMRMDDIQIVRGTFWCGTECVFTREIYSQGDASISAGTRLQAIASDGNLSLGPGVRIARWADSEGEMEIGPRAVVGARATARKSIHLHKGSQVGSACAPIVTTARSNPGTLHMQEELAAPALELPLPAAGAAPNDLARMNLDTKKLRPLGGECWLYEGDLKPSVALRLKSKLVVKGNCFMPDGSILEADLKAHGRIMLGARTVCRGNVIAGRDIWFGPASQFHGVVHAGKELRLGSGVCGGAPGAPVAVFAAELLTLEDNVAVYGKLASAGRVVVLPERSGKSV